MHELSASDVEHLSASAPGQAGDSKRLLSFIPILKRVEGLASLLGVLLVLGIVHALSYQASEPFFNNDETRHVMTGVYFRDFLHDLAFTHPRDYTIKYYLQYPALGLLMWPPFFYFVEGAFMSIFGTSFIAAKLLVGIYTATACVYLFFLVCRTHDASRAAVAVSVFGLAPLVFQLSSHVMLEMPTLAMSLAAIFHFVRYLDHERRRDLVLAGLFAALTALTRYDAVYLLPLFLILLAVRGRIRSIFRRDVLAVAALAAIVVLPFYALTTAGIGWFHFKNATEPVYPGQMAVVALERLYFYPSCLPEQLGWFALVPALVGFVTSLAAARRKQAQVYFVIVIACYLTFTPMAEILSRHTVYWIPAFAFFAADGIALIARWLRAPKLYVPLAVLVMSGMTWNVLTRPQFFVRGYREAARHVASNTQTSPFSLFLGNLNGNFIYQIRRHDPDRRLWVLRADKLLYTSLVHQQFGYKQFVETDEEILSTIFKYDPEFIVMEETHAPYALPIENRVREVIKNNPQRFQLEKNINVESNHPEYRGMQLKVFRNIFRNADPERHLDIEILMLRRSIQTDVP